MKIVTETSMISLHLRKERFRNLKNSEMTLHLHDISHTIESRRLIIYKRVISYLIHYQLQQTKFVVECFLDPLPFQLNNPCSKFFIKPVSKFSGVKSIHREELNKHVTNSFYVQRENKWKDSFRYKKKGNGLVQSKLS